VRRAAKRKTLFIRLKKLGAIATVNRPPSDHNSTTPERNGGPTTILSRHSSHPWSSSVIFGFIRAGRNEVAIDSPLDTDFHRLHSHHPDFHHPGCRRVCRWR
jgi:hypothetical protein